MQLRFPEQVITILADPIQSGEDALVVDTFTLQIEEGSLIEGVTHNETGCGPS